MGHSPHGRLFAHLLGLIMSTLNYCAKQATAMAEHATNAARAKLDDAIDAEEARDELIAARANEIYVKRMAEMAPIDVVAGLQSVLEDGSAPIIGRLYLAGDMEGVGQLVGVLIRSFIKSDSEVMAHDWMDRIDAEVAKWGAQ